MAGMSTSQTMHVATPQVKIDVISSEIRPLLIVSLMVGIPVSKLSLLCVLPISIRSRLSLNKQITVFIVIVAMAAVNFSLAECRY